MTIQQLSPELLSPNDYNPNKMTDDEFAELVAEVRHLGRLPKPVVVRPNGKGYVIVDGEHGWKAADEVGLKDISCEVIEVDDFEAMRQTYKRNQHGKHNPLLQGRMFKRMMGESGSSERAFAEKMELSEGTVRNSLEYVKAVDEIVPTLSNSDYVRNDYAERIQGLGVQQVRMLNRLPVNVGRLWLDSGADIRALFGTVGEPSDNSWNEKWEIDRYKKLAPLFDIAYRRLTENDLASDCGGPEVSDAKIFKKIKDRVNRMYGELSQYERGGLTREVLVPYFLRYWKRDFYVRDADLFRTTLAMITDTSNYPAKLVLTPDEWEAAFEKQKKLSGSARDFQNQLKALAFDKAGIVSDLNGYKLTQQLAEHEINNEAPEYVKESELSVQLRYDVWKTKGPDWKKQELLALKEVPGNWKWQLDNAEKDKAFAELEPAELAAAIVGTLKVYVSDICGVEMTEEDKSATINTLALLPRTQLRGLFDLAEGRAMLRVAGEMIGGRK